MYLLRGGKKNIALKKYFGFLMIWVPGADKGIRPGGGALGFRTPLNPPLMVTQTRLRTHELAYQVVRSEGSTGYGPY